MHTSIHKKTHTDISTTVLTEIHKTQTFTDVPTKELEIYRYTNWQTHRPTNIQTYQRQNIHT